MRFLLDTNIVIKLEPKSPELAEADIDAALEVQRLVSRGNHSLLIHPAIHHDIDRDTDPERQRRTRFLLQRYPELQSPPSSRQVETELGSPPHGSNNWVDNQLVAAVHAGAAHYLITEDAALRKRLRRVTGRDAAITVAEAAAMLRSLFDTDVTPPPAVESTFMYALDREDPIWQGFRDDYPPFDAWFADHCGDEARRAWIVRGDSAYAAVAIVKPEDTGEYGLTGRVLKITSFKVADSHRGLKLGELLLRAVFDFASENSYDHLYVTTLGRHTDLIALIEDFGFMLSPLRTKLDEVVYEKRLLTSDDDAATLSPLEYHIRFGPPALHPSGGPAFVVPIRPQYAELLFPAREFQLQLPGLAGAPRGVPRPYSNAIKKAYLCHAAARFIVPGSTLLFYRSHDEKAASVIGVAEKALVTADPEEIASFVGPRTVYSFQEITQMAEHGEVLAVLFRHDRTLHPAITLAELKANGALKSHPQSICSVKTEGEAWISSRIRR
jgi:GNAT superfamily N-acetyltransferase